jgi:phospho-N-acetylmuramoyl-pentapeptide-transferase
MNDALLLGVLSLTVTVIAGYPAVAVLRRLKVGKEISEWGPETHHVKAGTPTMGGLLIVAVVGVVTLAFNLFGRYSIAAPLIVMGALSLLGFVDDLGSLQGREQRALNKRVKLVAFIAIGAASAYGVSELLEVSQSVNVPWDRRRDLGDLYLAIVLGTVVLTAGGVAVADGLDGLVAGVGALAYGAYGIIALLQGQDYLGAFCFTVAGALVGFTWHNSYPARVFMGDTGALALGGGLAIIAFMTGQWLILPVIGAVFVADGASTYLQIGYYRLSGGRRIFRMAPLHHHFEKGGWSEVQVVQRFWAIGAVGAALGTVLATEAW